MTAPISRWLVAPLPADVEAALDRLARSDDVQRIAVMPDVHLADEVCIGTVVATKRLLYPDAVGGDIGCGVASVRFSCGAQLLDDARIAARLLAGLYEAVPTMHHPVAASPPLPVELERARLSHARLEAIKTREGRAELGTLGRGNHFLELQSDDQGELWLMLHSGSRALGQAIRDHHLHHAVPSRTGLRYVDAQSPSGEAYLADVAWALRYADENRRAMVRAVRDMMKRQLAIEIDEDTLVSCHHNHVRREVHDGEALWVHRKGAISASSGEAGIIPGSMGSPSYQVEGRGLVQSLCSSSHGAGRALTRTEARRSISTRALMRQLEGVWFDHRRADRLRDEAPSAYKDIQLVMRAQRDLTKIVRTVRPILSFKGG